MEVAKKTAYHIHLLRLRGRSQERNLNLEIKSAEVLIDIALRNSSRIGRVGHDLSGGSLGRVGGVGDEEVGGGSEEVVGVEGRGEGREHEFLIEKVRRRSESG